MTAASPAVAGRRSWFEGPRLWPVAVALVSVAVTAQLATSAAAGRDLLHDLPFALLVAGGGFGGAALRARWSRREWRRLRDSGGWAQGPLLAGLAVVVLAVLAVDGSPWWWPLCAAAAVAAVLLGRSAARQARRRAELEALR